MEEIEKAFNQTFANWDIQLPAEVVASRQSGKFFKGGWTIEYLFGSEEDKEYLDYYAVHRMTNDRHVRIHADGHCENLEMPMEFIVYPEGSDEIAQEQAKEAFYEHNRAVYERLREKGFMSR